MSSHVAAMFRKKHNERMGSGVALLSDKLMCAAGDWNEKTVVVFRRWITQEFNLTFPQLGSWMIMSHCWFLSWGAMRDSLWTPWNFYCFGPKSRSTQTAMSELAALAFLLGLSAKVAAPFTMDSSLAYTTSGVKLGAPTEKPESVQAMIRSIPSRSE